MTRIDRYLLQQLLGSFGFFALALAGILWLAQTLPLVEIIIDNGQSGFIFVEFSTLILPNVLMMVIPLASLASALYTHNRMMSESELPVLMAAGLSPDRIVRATAFLGLMTMGAMYILVIFLQPVASTRLGDRIFDLRQDAVASILRERQFIHPTSGVTIYVRDASEKGEMEGLFLHDQRDPKTPTTYTARQALLLSDNGELRLIMANGNIQHYSVKDGTLNTIEFEQFIFDLTDLINVGGIRSRIPLEYFIGELINPEGIIAEGGNRSAGIYISEGHQKLALPLLGFTLPFFAAAFLLAAKFRRSNYVWPIASASAIGVVILSFTLMIRPLVAAQPELYLLSYLPPLICFILTLAILHRTRNPGRYKKTKRVMA